MADSVRDLLDRSIEHLQSTKAEDVVLIDLRGIADFVDYFLICTGTSGVHVKALANAVVEGLKAEDIRPWQVEGYESRKWILIDYVDVVIHIFLPDTRTFYRLERLWGDAPIQQIEDESTLVESNP
ncbi:MAG: ribosome silencing factor [bacterium]|nr:ribosome silencing factor [bacterium]